MKLTFVSIAALGLLGLVQVASAQNQYPPQPDQTIQARVSGGGGSGKCTFEVVIDGAADVEVRGSEGRLRWVGGGGMSWRRLDCNQPLPRNPVNFRFKGVDGRGSQTLLKSPNQNNGVAVIRLDDPQRGTEGYTGDLLWDGGSDYGTPNRGNWPDRGDHDRDNWQNGGNLGRRAVSICQDAIRNQLGGRYGGYVTFNQSINTDQAGSMTVVQGVANARDRRGTNAYMQYSCVVRPNGSVSDAKYTPIDER